MAEWIAGKLGTCGVVLILAGTIFCSGWTQHGIAHAAQNVEASVPREAGVHLFPVRLLR